MNATVSRAAASALTTAGVLGAGIFGMSLVAHHDAQKPVPFELRFAQSTPAPVVVLPLTTGDPGPGRDTIGDRSAMTVLVPTARPTQVPTASPLQQITATAPVALLPRSSRPRLPRSRRARPPPLPQPPCLPRTRALTATTSRGRARRRMPIPTATATSIAPATSRRRPG